MNSAPLFEHLRRTPKPETSLRRFVASLLPGDWGRETENMFSGETKREANGQPFGGSKSFILRQAKDWSWEGGSVFGTGDDWLFNKKAVRLMAGLNGGVVKPVSCFK